MYKLKKKKKIAYLQTLKYSITGHEVGYTHGFLMECTAYRVTLYLHRGHQGAHFKPHQAKVMIHTWPTNNSCFCFEALSNMVKILYLMR